MQISSFTTYNFRNLSHQTVELSPSVTLFLGRNGHGKTNLIEAIFFVTSGRSFRTGKVRDLVYSKEKEASVFANITGEDSLSSLGITIKPSSLEYFLNHEKANSLREIVGRMPTVTFTPSDLDLVKGGPKERRSFIDKHLVDIDRKSLDSLLSYQRAVRHKNSLLKSGNAKPDTISMWNEIMAEHGEVVVLKRQALINSLIEPANRYYQHFSGSREKLSLIIKSKFFKEDRILNKREIFELLEKESLREISQESSLIGPHRDDFEILLNEKDTRQFASQGETRSVVLALKLAVVEAIFSINKNPPIILLDDVDSELDSYRRGALFEIVFSTGKQVIITTTELRSKDQLLPEGYGVYKVNEGKVTREE